MLLAGRTSPHGSVEFRRLVVTAKRRDSRRTAGCAVKHFAFRERLAHRLWIDVMEHNTVARRLRAGSVGGPQT